MHCDIHMSHQASWAFLWLLNEWFVFLSPDMTTMTSGNTFPIVTARRLDRLYVACIWILSISMLTRSLSQAVSCWPVTGKWVCVRRNTGRGSLWTAGHWTGLLWTRWHWDRFTVDSGTLDRLIVDKVTLGQVHCGQQDTGQAYCGQGDTGTGSFWTVGHWTGLLWTRWHWDRFILDSGTLDRLIVDKVTLGQVRCGQRNTGTGLL